MSVVPGANESKELSGLVAPKPSARLAAPKPLLPCGDM